MVSNIVEEHKEELKVEYAFFFGSFIFLSGIGPSGGQSTSIYRFSAVEEVSAPNPPVLQQSTIVVTLNESGILDYYISLDMLRNEPNLYLFCCFKETLHYLSFEH